MLAPTQSAGIPRHPLTLARPPRLRQPADSRWLPIVGRITPASQRRDLPAPNQRSVDFQSADADAINLRIHLCWGLVGAARRKSSPQMLGRHFPGGISSSCVRRGAAGRRGMRRIDSLISAELAEIDACIHGHHRCSSAAAITSNGRSASSARRTLRRGAGARPSNKSAISSATLSDVIISASSMWM